MIRIDAGQGEGGGQVLRAALALSAVRGVPVELRGIRAGRKPPGLQPQHLTAVTALGRICDAEVSGAALGSQAVRFVPGPVRPATYRFDIGTAGSIPLLLQALLLPLALAGGPSRLTLIGGTHVPWSPPADFVRDIFLPRVAQMGICARLEVCRWGLYPHGGGRIEVEVDGSAALSPLSLVRRAGAVVVRGVSAAGGLPRDAAERLRQRAARRLAEAGHAARIDVGEITAADPGSFVFLTADYGGGRAGFSGLGGRGDEPERVADAAVDGLLEFVKSDAACDPYLADQLVVPLALAAGTSRFTTSRVTPHLVTAVSLAQQILGCPAQVRGDIGSPGSVTLEGVGVGGTGAAGGRRDLGSGRGARPEPPPGEGGSPAVSVRKARAADGPAIQKLLAHFASRGELLPRTLNEVYQHLRDFVVGETEGRIVGVCALWLYWEDLAEVRSLAVEEGSAGRGLGTALVDACLAEAAALGIRRVFALTYRPGFFERLGFRRVDKRELPQKIWKDCLRCAKFTCCDEIALILDVEPPARSA
jgi:RNA 3'-terminal phosphate cyclase (ATP)